MAVIEVTAETLPGPPAECSEAALTVTKWKAGLSFPAVQENRQFPHDLNPHSCPPIKPAF